MEWTGLFVVFIILVALSSAAGEKSQDGTYLCCHLTEDLAAKPQRCPNCSKLKGD